MCDYWYRQNRSSTCHGVNDNYTEDIKIFRFFFYLDTQTVTKQHKLAIRGFKPKTPNSRAIPNQINVTRTAACSVLAMGLSANVLSVFFVCFHFQLLQLSRHCFNRLFDSRSFWSWLHVFGLLLLANDTLAKLLCGLILGSRRWTRLRDWTL